VVAPVNKRRGIGLASLLAIVVYFLSSAIVVLVAPSFPLPGVIGVVLGAAAFACWIWRAPVRWFAEFLRTMSGAWGTVWVASMAAAIYVYIQTKNPWWFYAAFAVVALGVCTWQYLAYRERPAAPPPEPEPVAPPPDEPEPPHLWARPR